MEMQVLGRRARQASKTLRMTSTQAKDTFLEDLSSLLLSEQEGVLAANRQDLEEARLGGLSEAMLDRLALDPKRLEGMARGLLRVAALPDPVGEIFEPATLPNGLRLYKQRVPLGVLGVIYESRPDVTIDVAALAAKSGNAVILRGGSEALRSNLALGDLVRRGLQANGLPEDAVQMVDDASRERVLEMLRLNEFIDLIIPRGGAGLHRFARENATIPVITGGVGICHLFVDRSADLVRAIPLILNAKTQRPTVCNALDTVLVDESIAETFLPALAQALSAAGVAVRADPRAFAILDPLGLPAVTAAGADDFDTEWLSLVLGVKVVDSLEEAIAHIAEHSTGHSDGILTDDLDHARRFTAQVDSAAVYVNASTRFTDGGEFGLGAEVAISTQRLQARGPMGLRELTSYKWVVEGDYAVRA